MRLVGVLIVTAGCAAEYRVGDFTQQTMRFDCLDVAVEARRSSEAEGPVLHVGLGNRCNHSIAVDLTHVRVHAIVGGGVRIALAVRDPRDELRVVRLDAHLRGDEWLEYPLPSVALDVELDVELGPVEPGARFDPRPIRLAVP